MKILFAAGVIGIIMMLISIVVITYLSVMGCDNLRECGW